MYQEFFRLHESPFSLDPDPRFLYLSPAHATARAYLEYTVESRDGMVVLTGHAGCGKSILVADLCRRVNRADILVLDQTQLDPHELLQSLLLALGEDSQGDRPQLRARLREVLCDRIRRGRRTTLIVDEAQHLSWEALETLRMVADQQDQGRRLLAVILVGQLGLARTLKAEGMEQFRQRVRLFYTLEPLPRQEIRRYIEHRLGVAGTQHDVIISPRALKYIMRYTGGVPRLINTLMDMALTAASLERTRMISAKLVREAALELQWGPYIVRHGRLFFGDRMRQLTGWIRPAGDVLMRWGRKIGRSAAVRGSALKLRAARLFERMPAQWVAGLGGAALVLVPVAFLLPSWLTQQPSTSFSTRPVVMRATPEAPAAVITIETIKRSAIPPSRRRHEPPVAAEPAPLVAVLEAPSARSPEADLASAPPRVAPTAATRIVSKQAIGAAEAPGGALSSSSLRDASWLLQQPAEAYSMQLFAASSEAAIQRFLGEHGEGFRGDRELAAFTADRDGRPWHVLVMASYASYADTREAIGKLPADLRKYQPWVRRLEIIHEALRDSTRQVGVRSGGQGALVADSTAVTD